MLDRLSMPRLDPILMENVLVHGGRAFKQKVGAHAGFWEGNHVSDGLGLAKYGHQSVEA